MTLRPETRRSPTALVVGHVTHDRFDQRVRAGGSAFYAAKTTRALGARARLVSTVGVDFERYEELRGLEMLLTVRDRTTTFENSYEAGRPRIQRVGAVGAAVTPRSLPPEWRKADVLFLAPVIGEVDVPNWLDTIDAPIVGLGLQGVLKGPGERNGSSRSIVPRPFELADEVLARVTVAFLSDEDVVELASLDLLDRLRRVVPTVVLTEGARGSRLWTRSGTYRVGTFPVVSRDPTGAGDVYAAAFLVAMSEGARPGDAALLASAAASVVIEEEGGIALERLGNCRERAAAVPLETGC
jgi:bifunctional ADP-heptose synthase (sugar kinase/adenylyltransferase)